MWCTPRIFHPAKSNEKKLTQPIKESFLIVPLNTNNVIYRDSLTLRANRKKELTKVCCTLIFNF